jgi:hypothetical protein
VRQGCKTWASSTITASRCAQSVQVTGLAQNVRPTSCPENVFAVKILGQPCTFWANPAYFGPTLLLSRSRRGRRLSFRPTPLWFAQSLGINKIMGACEWRCRTTSQSAAQLVSHDSHGGVHLKVLIDSYIRLSKRKSFRKYKDYMRSRYIATAPRHKLTMTAPPLAQSMYPPGKCGEICTEGSMHCFLQEVRAAPSLVAPGRRGHSTLPLAVVGCYS